MILAECRAAELESWLIQAEHRRLPEFKKMAHGIRQDYAAVKAAFSSEWSNGQARSPGQPLKTSETHRGRQSQFRLWVCAGRNLPFHVHARLLLFSSLSGASAHYGILEKGVEEGSKQASKSRDKEHLLESMTGRPSPLTKAPASRKLSLREWEHDGDDGS